MNDLPAAKPKGGALKWALWGVAIFGVAAVVYIMAQASFKPTAPKAQLASLAKGDMATLRTLADAGPQPVNSFYGPDGKALRLADFKGKVVVLNLWATWCAPCVEEMPTLARLQAEYDGQPVEVVTVSVDSPGEVDKAKAFIAQHPPLKFYNDPKMKLPFALVPAAAGMPTTVIYGKDGVERGRLSGAAVWSGADAKAVVDKVLAG
jgi:thiol-disulfide isomerase/thioredoxin